MKNSHGGCFSSSLHFRVLFDLIFELLFKKNEIEK